MSTKIKICGLTRLEDIRTVNQAKPDYIGFVFAPSKRQVTLAQARSLKEKLDPSIEAVGVFVNETLENIRAICEQKIITVVQLHGDEPPEFSEAVQRRTGCRVTKALRIKDRDSLRYLEAYQKADYLLLDAYSREAYGGTGEVFNWDLLRKHSISTPFFLAGGLDSENIEAAIVRTNPYGLDISSGVETDGIKDPKKIIEIIEKIRRIDR